MMQYTEVDFRLTNEFSCLDILIAMLNEIRFESYLEYDKGIKAYINTKLLNKDEVEKIISKVSAITEISYSINTIQNKNWNLNWESNYDPVFINKKCIIRADYHTPRHDVRYEIIIAPNMSFGTGHHETTYLMMNKMFDLEFKNKYVLDIGCGTGILSILASKLEAEDVLSVDNNELAVNSAKQNFKYNNINNIKLLKSDSNSIVYDKYDVILANINRNVILSDISMYSSILNNDGDVLLSGFFEDDISLILNKTEKLGLKLVDKKNKNKWKMIHLKRV